MDRNDFWNLVNEIGWGTETTDCKAVRLSFLKTMTAEQVREARDHLYALRGQLYEAASEAGHDYCCDSWDDTLNHVVGLGKEEWEANLADPDKLVDRMNRSDYSESFAHCFPWGDEYEDLKPSALQARAEDLVTRYDEKLTALDDDLAAKVIRMMNLLEPLTTDINAEVDTDEINQLADDIVVSFRAKVKALMGSRFPLRWDGGNPLSNRACVQNLIIDRATAQAIAA